MLNTIKKSIRYNQNLVMIYMDGDGAITKRRIKAINLKGESFVAYCYLRRSTRTFKFDNVLALVTVNKNSTEEVAN